MGILNIFEMLFCRGFESLPSNILEECFGIASAPPRKYSEVVVAKKIMTTVGVAATSLSRAEKPHQYNGKVH